MRISKDSPLLQAIATGLLLGLAWTPLPLGVLLFIAFIPLLICSDSLLQQYKPYQFFAFSFLALALRNLITLYWIGMVSPAACLGSIVLLSFVFAAVLVCFQWSRKTGSRLISYLLLITLWVSAEWFCEEVLRFPWTSLGFGLAQEYSLVQWYEFTGIYGGTIWILGINILLYETYRTFTLPSGRQTTFIRRILAAASLIAILAPAGSSCLSYFNYRPSMDAIQVVVVQSDVSPHEKFKPEAARAQLARLIKLSRSAGKLNTEYFIWPETAIEPFHALNEDSLVRNESVLAIRNFLEAYPSGNVIAGAMTFRQNLMHPADTNWYNTALHIENSDKIQLYHKSKLVPGTETTMFQDENGKAHGVSLYLGGLTKTFSTTPNDIFYAESGMGIAPAICFESVFGAYISHDLVFKGAQLIAVISNDAWWGKSSGTSQHMEYLRLLAIENRRSVACSSNGGISCLIDQQGNLISKIPAGTEGAISAELLLREEPSFYAAHPQYIPLASLLLAILGILASVVLLLMGKKGTLSLNRQGEAAGK